MVLSLILSITTYADPCPIQGDAKNDTTAATLNMLKNRDPATATRALPLALWMMLAPGDDTNRFDARNVVSITGYVMRVIPGGIESCNCRAKDASHRDTHIYVALDGPHAKPAQCVIVEVTPRSRNAAAARGENWSTATLNKTLVGKTVTFTGYLLFDSEHKQNAVNTNPSNKRDWRATANEIHPVTGIKIN